MPPKLYDILNGRGVSSRSSGTSSSLSAHHLPVQHHHQSGSSSSLRVGAPMEPSTHTLTSSTLGGDTRSVRDKILATRQRSHLIDHKMWAMDIAFGSSAAAGIVVEFMEISLICPYSQLRMTLPVRSSACRHIQCCDLDSWAVLFTKFRTMRDPAVPCPVCDERVCLSTLHVDEWLVTVLQHLPTARFVVLLPNGSYQAGGVAAKRKRDAQEEACVVLSQDDTDFPDDVHGHVGDGTWGMVLRSSSKGALPTTATALDPISIKKEYKMAEAAQYHASSSGADGEWRSDYPAHNGTSINETMDPLAADTDAERDDTYLPPTPSPTLAHEYVTLAAATDREQATESSSAASTVTLKRSDSSEPPIKTPTTHLLSSLYYKPHARPLPTTWRQWTFFCACVDGTVNVLRVPDPSGNDDVICDGEDTTLTCPRCGVSRPRFEWPALRVYLQVPLLGDPQQQWKTSMEVTDDGTVVLRGVCRGVEKYLAKAGFLFTSSWWMETCLFTATPCSISIASAPYLADAETVVTRAVQELNSTVWVSSRCHSRLELDFLDSLLDLLSKTMLTELEEHEQVGFPPSECWRRALSTELQYQGFVPTVFKFRWQRTLAGEELPSRTQPSPSVSTPLPRGPWNPDVPPTPTPITAPIPTTATASTTAMVASSGGFRINLGKFGISVPSR